MPGAIAFVPARNIVGAPRTPVVAPARPAVKPAPSSTTNATTNATTSATTPTSTTTAVALPTAKEEGRPILLFNDQCEVCHALSAWVKKQDTLGGDLIDERPIGDDPAELNRLDPRLDIWDVYKQIHLLMPDGSIKVGGA